MKQDFLAIFLYASQAYLLTQGTGIPNAGSCPPREHYLKLALTSVFFNSVFILHNNFFSSLSLHFIIHISVSNSYRYTDLLIYAGVNYLFKPVVVISAYTCNWCILFLVPSQK